MSFPQRPIAKSPALSNEATAARGSDLRGAASRQEEQSADMILSIIILFRLRCIASHQELEVRDRLTGFVVWRRDCSSVSTLITRPTAESGPNVIAISLMRIRRHVFEIPWANTLFLSNRD
jgi:hypothetical protein